MLRELSDKTTELLSNVTFVTRKSHFNAAHRLHNPDRSDEWNRERYGKCNLPNWHGHNYVLEVTVTGEIDPETGYLIDLGALQSLIELHVVEPCDHRNLNLDVDFLQGVIPTAENLAKAFFERLQAPVGQACSSRGRLFSVRLYETERNIAEYRIE